MLRNIVKTVIISLLFLAGCGYHLRGMGDTLPDDLKTIAISPFANESYESDLGPLLDLAIAEEFSKTKRLKIVPEGEADLLLTGVIMSYKNRPVSFSSSDLARDYRVEITADVLLKKRVGEEVLWKGKGIKEVADYSVTPGDVGLAEERRDAAKEEVSDEMAELIYDTIFEGF